MFNTMSVSKVPQKLQSTPREVKPDTNTTRQKSVLFKNFLFSILSVEEDPSAFRHWMLCLLHNVGMYTEKLIFVSLP